MARNSQQHSAAADDLAYKEPLEIPLHCDEYKRSVFTECDLGDVLKISDFFQSYAAHDLRWCSLCQEKHPPNLICFSNTCMTAEDQDILQQALNSNLHFQWTTDGYEDQVFPVCRYFLISEDHLLPQFLNSLTPDYARFYDTYNYLTYLNKHSYSLFVSPSLPFRATSYHDFLSAVRSLPNQASLKRKDLVSSMFSS